MKRLQIITKPTKLSDLADIDTQDYDDPWLLKAEKWHHDRKRKLRRHLAT
jgi:hypothetical protein